MTKDLLSDYDSTAANNTDVGGVTISENCNFGNMNNMGREIMSHIADWLAEASLASASASNMATTAATCVNITGTTTISSFGTVKAGVFKFVRFAGALTLTHNATSFILPGGADITTVAGDTAVFKSEGSGNWRCHSYVRGADAPFNSALYLLLAGGTMTGTLAMGDNKITRPQIEDYSETVNAIGSIGGGTQDIDLELGNVVTATVDTSTTTFTFSNPPATGKAGSFTLILTNGGSQTVNWPASVDWGNSTAPTLTTAGVDILSFVTVDAGTTWYGFTGGLDFG